MLNCLSSLEQFGQGVGEKPTWPRPRWFEGSYEINKGTWIEAQIAPKSNSTKLEANPKK
jgi:hypothetical protein